MREELGKATDSSSVSRRYTKRLHQTAELQVLTSWAAIFAFGYFGWSATVASYAGLYTRNVPAQVALCFVAMSVLWLAVSLPFWFYTFHLRRQLMIDRITAQRAFPKALKAGVLVLLVIGVYVEIAYLTHTSSLPLPWLWAAALCSVVFVCKVRSHVWLISRFYPVTPLRDEAIDQRIKALAQRANVGIAAVREVQISTDTRVANAWTCGAGRTREVLLTDTLIETLSPEELDAIVAHELGHCAHHDVLKRVALNCAVFAVIFFAIDKMIGLGVLPDFWNKADDMPWFCLAWLTSLSWSAIFAAAWSRRQERSADLFGWQLTGNVEHFITAIQKITKLNLVSYDKDSEWKYSHPVTADRLLQAIEYGNRQGRQLSPTTFGIEVPVRLTAGTRAKNKLFSLAQATLVATGILVGAAGPAVWYVAPEKSTVAILMILAGVVLIAPFVAYSIIAKLRKTKSNGDPLPVMTAQTNQQSGAASDIKGASTPVAATISAQHGKG